MATTRRRDPDDVGAVIRDVLIAKYRANAETFPSQSPYREPWTVKADALERGERITVAGWEMAPFVPGLGPHGWWIVEPDGSLTPTQSPAMRG